MRASSKTYYDSAYDYKDKIPIRVSLKAKQVKGQYSGLSCRRSR